MKRGMLLSLLTATVTFGVTVLIILFAKGYWFNPQTGKVIRTGLLAVNSTPASASIYINSKLSDATNATIKLEPGSYHVLIEKDGYQPWQKTIQIVEEIVTPIYALLLPTSPELKPLITTGAINPVLAPDGTVLTYAVPATSSASRVEQAGIWTLSLVNRSPLSLIKEDKPVKIAADTNLVPFSKSLLTWSPTGDQILALIPQKTDPEQTFTQKEVDSWSKSPDLLPQKSSLSAWLLLPHTPAERQLPQESDDLTGLLSAWKNTSEFKISSLLRSYPAELRQEATAAAILKFSPDEKRFLFQTKDGGPASVVWKKYTNVEKKAYGPPDKTFLPNGIEKTNSPEASLPASPKSTRPQTLVAQFDLPAALSYEWLPESENTHLVMVEPAAISIIEADGRNKTTIYTGEIQENFAIPWPDGSKIIILTNLNRAMGTAPNLYTLSLR